MTASIPRSSFLERQAATNEILKSVAARHPDVQVFFPTDRMCMPDCITSIGGEFLFRDSSHLRRNLSAAAIEQLDGLLLLPDLLLGLGGHAQELAHGAPACLTDRGEESANCRK
jgi:hypothetical protein